MSERLLLRVDGLRARRGGVDVVFDVNLSVAAGASVALLGPNGAGKSTTIDAICSQAEKSGGRVLFDGDDVTRLPTHLLARRGLVQVSQDRDLFPLLTVGDNLELGREAVGRGKSGGIDLENLLSAFPILADRWGQRAASLSGGEQQMLAVARALISGPKLIFLDEPSSGLAPAMVDSLIDLLRAVVTDDLTLVLTEQNIDIAMDLCSEFTIVRQGCTVFTGRRQDLGDDPRAFIADQYMASRTGEDS